MEEFDDDDEFSDLYADVEVQASSAMSAMHGLTDMPLPVGAIPGNAISGSPRLPGIGKMYKTATEGERVDEDEEEGVDRRLTKISVENGRNYSSADNAHRGDSDVVIQKSRDDSKENRVDETADDGLDFRGNEEAKVASQRDSRLTHTRVPVSPDLDDYGNVQISDSEEYNQQEVSDYDSDGTAEALDASDNTNTKNVNRRNGSSISNGVRSAQDSESTQSGESQGGPDSSCSPSPRPGLSDDDVEKVHKCSSRADWKLKEEVTRQYHLSKGSKSHGIKPSSRDHRYSDRSRSPFRNVTRQYNRSNRRSYLETQLNGKGLRNMHQSMNSRGNNRVMLNSFSYEKAIYDRPDSYFAYLDGYLPGHPLRAAYFQNQYWNVHPNLGYEAGSYDSHNTNERQGFLAKKHAGDHNQRRHAVQDYFEDPRKLMPKCASNAVSKLGTRDDLEFRRKTKQDVLPPIHDHNIDHRRFMLNNDGDRDHRDHRYHDRRETESRGRGERRYYSPLTCSDNLWPMETEDSGRSLSKGHRSLFHSHKESNTCSGDRDHYHRNHRCDHNIPRDRREKECPGRGKRRKDGSLSDQHSLWHIEAEDVDGRFIKHEPVVSHFHREPCSPNRGRFQEASRPKLGGPQRHLTCSWKEIQREGRYGSKMPTFDGGEYHTEYYVEDRLVKRKHGQRSTNCFATNENIRSHYDQDHFFRRRHLQKPEVLHLSEDLYEFREQDCTMSHAEGPSNHSDKISRNKRSQERHASDHVTELIDEREIDRHRFKLIREEACSGNPNFFRLDGHVQRYQESFGPTVVVGKKRTWQTSRTTSRAEDVIYNGKYMDPNCNQERQNFDDLNVFNPEKAALLNEGQVDTYLSDTKFLDKCPNKPKNGFLDIEEGQIVSEESNEKPSERVIASEEVTQIKVVQGLDDQKIQEIIAKMERRRERFKDPVTLSRDSEKISKHLPDLNAETAEGKLERPARKRRWSGV